MDQRKEYNYEKGNGRPYEEELNQRIDKMTAEEKAKMEELLALIDQNTKVIKEGED